MHANLLLIEIIRYGLTLNDISKLLGISHATAYQKLNNINLLTVSEALLLKDTLDLSDQEAVAMFLGA